MPKITCMQGLLETLYSLDIILKEQIWALHHRSRETRLSVAIPLQRNTAIHLTHTHTHAKTWSEFKDFGRSHCSVCVVTLILSFLWWIALCRMESCKSCSSSKASLYITAPFLMCRMHVCFLSHEVSKHTWVLWLLFFLYTIFLSCFITQGI